MEWYKMKKLVAVLLLLLTLTLIGCGKQTEKAEDAQDVSVSAADETNAAQTVVSAEQAPSFPTREFSAVVVGAWPTKYGQYFMRIQKEENKAVPRVFDYTGSENVKTGQKVKMTLNVYDEVIGLSPA